MSRLMTEPDLSDSRVRCLILGDKAEKGCVRTCVHACASVCVCVGGSREEKNGRSRVRKKKDWRIFSHEGYLTEFISLYVSDFKKGH